MSFGATGLALSPRDRRTLLAGLASVGAILTLGRGLPAVRAWQSARLSSAADAQRTLMLEEQGAASFPQMRDSLAVRVRTADSLRARLLGGLTVEAAASALARVVERAAEAQGMDVENVTFLADSAVRLGLTRVTARITAQGDLDGLMNFLNVVESHRALLSVRSLFVSQPDPAAPTSRADALRVEIAVVAMAAIPASTKHAETSLATSVAPPSLLAPPRKPLSLDGPAMIAALEAATSANAFRLSHLPADVPYQPAASRAAQVPPAPAPRPALVLKGIVGGPPWQAIIDGIPGQPSSTIAAAGAVFDKLVVRAVARDSVVVRGPDTTWVLTLDRKAP